MNPIKVKLGERSYGIFVERGLSRLPRELKPLSVGTHALVITNPKVKTLFGAETEGALKRSGLKAIFILIADSEKAKSLGAAVELLRNVSKYDGKGRRLCIVALGGGVAGDLAGFVASIYRRGIPYIQIPTTLLAQVDSSIGGKTAIDLPEGKNLVGSFYQPRMVYANTLFLNELSERDYRSGLAEVIKYAILKDSKLFDYLDENISPILKRESASLSEIVKRCAQIKAEIVSKDERETKALRTTLNLGHTVGHAIEAASAYSSSYSHGEAVAIGIAAASRISNLMGYLGFDELARIDALMTNFCLPIKIKEAPKPEDILKALSYDKKFIHGVNRFVLPVKIGRVIIKERIPESLIRKVLLA